MKTKIKYWPLLLCSFLLAGCSQSSNTQSNTTAETTQDSAASGENADQAQTQAKDQSGSSSSDQNVGASDFFTDRDLEQSVDLSQAQELTLNAEEDTTITTAGIYRVSGSYSNAGIVVEAGDDDKVQIVLDNVEITNDYKPVIYVKNADKLFVTTTEGSDNSLTTQDVFTPDGETNLDAVIFSRDDVILNGQGTLNITSSDNAVSSKDDIKVTGGTINIAATSDGLEANEQILINDGQIAINSYKDCIHAENDEDLSTGKVYVFGGDLVLTGDDDGIQATSYLQIDGGAMNITAAEGLEATQIVINEGEISIEASDDGINASNKSDSTPSVTINSGTIQVDMGAGDTDAIDSNGDLFINGGTITLNAQSPFDYDGSAEKNGGTLIINGTETEELSNQFGGGGKGGFGGRGMGGDPFQDGGMMGEDPFSNGQGPQDYYGY